MGKRPIQGYAGGRSYASMHVTLPLLAYLSFGLLPSSPRAQPAPLDEEILVNTNMLGEQTNPAVTADAAGNFLVVWESVVEPPSRGVSVRGQRYANSGSPIGTEFQVSSAYLRAGSYPDVAMSADGSFLVVWRKHHQDDYPRILGRAYNSQALPAGDQFFVDDNGAPTGYYGDYGEYRGAPAVAAGPGEFMVVWSGGTQLLQYFGFESYLTIRGRSVDTSGALSGTEFRAGGSGNYWTVQPDIAANTAGEFVVVWSESSYEYGYDYSYGEYTRTRTFYVHGRVLDSQGAPTSGTLTDGSDGYNGYRGTAVAAASDGGFIVAWARSDVSGREVRARRYDSNAVAIGNGFVVSAPPDAPQPGTPDAGRFGLDLSANGNGQFTVVWAESSSGDYGNSDGSSTGVFARTFAADGAELGSPIQINSYTTSGQSAPSIAPIGNDEVVIAWRSYGQDGDARGVVARRFARTPECGDATADGQITASDGLLALRAAVGVGSCAPCVCDADRSGRVLASDSLLILKVAVGEPGALMSCVSC